MKNKRLLGVIAFSLLFISIFLVFIFRDTLIKGYSTMMKYIENPESFKALINMYGSKGVFLFLLFQIVQVVIAFIPGEAVQFLGGVVYGPIWGIIYSLIGILIGEVIVFYIARFIGKAIISRFISFDKLKKFERQINSKRSDTIMFVLFLIPGISKDTLTYFAGFTPIKPLKFFIISMLGRLPALIGSTLLGHSYLGKDYKTMVIVIGGLTLFCVIGYAIKKRLDAIK